MRGKVYLIGAGPGDPGLITVRGLECIKKADVVVYDRLASDLLLEETKETCRFIYVGKEAKNHAKTQDEINEIIYREALEGNMVVRLKGGDPYVFGRGGEEGKYLAERGIDFETIPGITSSIAGLTYAGIPITHRDYASSFHVITGHLKDEEKELDWNLLAKLKGTLVFLMGVSNLKNICENLVENGKSKETPVAIINWATTPYQKVVEGDLLDIYEKALKENITPPSLIVVGDVVKLRKDLNFFEKKTLFGKTIVITRAKSQGRESSNRLAELGAMVYEFPTIKIDEISPNLTLDEAIENIDRYTHLVLTSKNGVDIFFKRLFSLGHDARKLGKLKIAVIGPKTGKTMEIYGIRPDIISDEYVGESLVDMLKDILDEKDRILIPRAKSSRPYVVEELSKICRVDEVKIYDTLKEESNPDDMIDFLSDKEESYFIFTSSSTFKNLIDILGDGNRDILNRNKLISIGPITSDTIRRNGYEVYGEAEKYTIDGIMDILVKEGEV